MNNIFKIAVAQVRAGTDREENTRLAEEILKKSAAQGADIVLFPECFLTGYHLPISYEAALPENSEYIERIRRAARENNIGALITALTQGEKKPRNTAFVIGKNGEILMRYDKVHTCDFSLEACLESGDEFRVCDFGGVKLGVMICYDREYPESARVLMMKGAEIILVPNDCTAMEVRLRALSTRAYENMTGVVMANPPGEGAGKSCAYSPICWDDDGKCADMTVFEGDEFSEKIYFAEFDMVEIRAYREDEMMGNTFRKVKAYAELLSAEVGYPFVRARGD